MSHLTAQPSERNHYPWTARQLRELEEASWKDQKLRELYATTYVDGFPWITVVEPRCRSKETPSAAQGRSRTTANSHCNTNHLDLDNSKDSEHQHTRSFDDDDECWTVRRHVVPYDYTFKVFVKGRWVGRDLLSVYSEELSHHSPAYYRKCIRLGRLRVVTKASLHSFQGHGNAQRRKTKRSHAIPDADTNKDEEHKKEEQASNLNPTTPTLSPAPGPSVSASSSAASMHQPSDPGLMYRLQHGDLVLHTVHRHEIPITMNECGEVVPIEILAVRIRRYGLIAVQKPCGLPTHATGRYFYNAAVSMLEYVLAPRRLDAWLWQEDPLLQSLVYTGALSIEEKKELHDYYSGDSHPMGSDGCRKENKSRKCGDDHHDLNEEDRYADSTKAIEVELDKCPRPCHRLDRVTSGVLLLGVSGPATRRLSTALMNKTKSVQHTVEEELAETLRSSDAKSTLSSESSLHKGRHPHDETGALRPAERIVCTPLGIYKRYLARVSGVWEWASVIHSISSESTAVSARVGPCDGTERAACSTTTSTSNGDDHRPASASPAARHQKASQQECGENDNNGVVAPVVVHSIDSSLLLEHNRWTTQHLHGLDLADSAVSQDKAAFPHGVLVTIPISSFHTPATATATTATPNLSSCEGGATEPASIQHGGAASERGSTPSTRSETQVGGDGARLSSGSVAATLVQRLRDHSDTDGAPSHAAAVSSCVVLCLPLTGRLHQIRFHLSRCGHPIVGDTAYDYRCQSSDSRSGDERKMEKARLEDVHPPPCDISQSTTPTTLPVSSFCPDSEDVEVLFFNPDTSLPAPLRALLPTTVQKMQRTRPVENPPQHPHQLHLWQAQDDDGQQKVRGDHSSSAIRLPKNADDDEAEPLCYECAGRLPLAVIPRVVGSGPKDGVCLHAWSYTIDESVILSEPHQYMRQEDGKEASVNEKGQACPAEEMPQEAQVTFSTRTLPSWVYA